MNNLNSQTKVVIRQLITLDNKTLEEAHTLWFGSKTKQYLEENSLYYVSGMRCYWELCLELACDSRWLYEPFDM